MPTAAAQPRCGQASWRSCRKLQSSLPLAPSVRGALWEGVGAGNPTKDKELPLAGGCLPFQKRTRHCREVSDPVFLGRRHQWGKVGAEEASGWEWARACAVRQGRGEGARGPALDFGSPSLLRSGPTVLEMFNTLLRQLRLSIDYALTGSYDGAISLGTKIDPWNMEFWSAVLGDSKEQLGGVCWGLNQPHYYIQKLRMLTIVNGHSYLVSHISEKDSGFS